MDAGLGSSEVAGGEQTAAEQNNRQLRSARRWQTTGSLAFPAPDQSATAMPPMSMHVTDLPFDTTVELEVAEDAYFRTEVTDNQASPVVQLVGSVLRCTS